MELEPNTVLAGRYRITDLLAKGGMGVVYRAQDQRLSRLVAIKTVRYQDPSLVDRLRREAQLLASLTHPNVVGLYDVGEHDGRPYLVTQFVDGQPLRRLLGRMSERRIAWVVEQITNALAAAHALGIVHRDLKPSNILVGDGTVRLLDFGIARHINDAVLTRTETLLGTAAYISPEQLHGHPAGPGADIYALGLVLIECFSGRPAFVGTFAETVAARMIERPALPDELPAPWHELVTAMTDPDAAARPAAVTVGAAVRALGRSPGQAVAMPVTAAGAAPEVDPRRIPLPVAAPIALATAPRGLGPGGGRTWADAEPLRPRRRFARPSVVVPAAALAGFLAVVTIGGLTAGGGGDPERASSSGDGSSQSIEDVTTETMPVTSGVSTTITPEVLAAEAFPVPAEPVTTQPPTTPPRVKASVPAPPPPPPPPPAPPATTKAPASTRPPATRRPTTTTTCRRWFCRRP